MARELFNRMQSATAPSEYVGALLPQEGRLVVVPVNEEDPWESFRKLRRAMRKERSAETAVMGLFEAETPLERKAADVISLESRRRAG